MNTIKKAVEAGKAKLGYKEVMRGLEQGTIKEVYLSANAPESHERDISQACKLAGISCTKVEQANDELGVVCKKPFSISVVGLTNE